METQRVERTFSVYKHEFDKFALNIFGDHYLDRKSLDMENMSFRIRYMIRHGLDTSYVKDRYIHTAYETNRALSKVIHTILTDVMGVNDEKVIDFFTMDMEIDSVMVKFKLVVISNDQSTLHQIEKYPSFFRIYPNEFFRISTDSYNDAIAKVYPELFSERHVDVGTGDDGEVFVHNLTLQTTENCSLNCFAGGTMIQTADMGTKPIEKIEYGDKVMAFDDRTIYPNKMHNRSGMVVSNVTKRRNKVWEIDCEEKITKVTPDHPIFTNLGWVMLKNIIPGIHKIGIMDKGRVGLYRYTDNYIITPTDEWCDVYNFETVGGTYIANNLMVHNCSYCYQAHKSEIGMDFNTAKVFIDKLLRDEFGYINRYNSPALILEFIGGEPFLEIELTRKIYEYFLDQTYQLDHPWFDLHRVSICSNGLAYMKDEVQDFFRDYSDRISFNISIDGNKELHDACRVQPNGEGSYDIAMNALNHYNKYYSKERNSKMTLAPQNIQYLYDSVIDFIEKGAKSINLNCVFEEGWNQETALCEYQQLKKLSDWLIENGMENLFLSVFNDRQEDRSKQDEDRSFCGGGSGSMLAIHPSGDIYPCLRYMPSSIGSEDIKMGSVFDKFVERSDGSDILKKMDENTRRSQSNDICYDCPIGNDCANCSALGYQVYGDLNKRTTFTCIQMIAEALANVYYYNRLNIAHPEYNLGVRKNNVPDEWALLVIPQEELDELNLLESVSMLVTLENRGGGDER